MPEKKDKIHVQVSASNGMKNLLLDAEVTKDIAQCYPSIEKVFLQLQRDALMREGTSPEGQASGWGIARGIAESLEVFLMMKTEGEHDLKK